MNTPVVERAGTKLGALADGIHLEHLAATNAARSAIEHARRCGQLLLAAKAEVGHGAWLPWLQANCPDVSERTSQMYMRLAREWPALEEAAGDPKRVSDLTLREAFALLRPRPAVPLPVAELGPGGSADADCPVDEEATAPAPPTLQYVREVRLILTVADYEAFGGWVQALSQLYGTSNNSDTVVECLRRAVVA